MYRDHLLQQIDRYGDANPSERATGDQIALFVRSHPDCFLRSCEPGHVTGSAWVVSAARDRCLLTRHKKLNRWLQVGGHSDGEPEVERAARREAQEESGIWVLDLWRPGGEVLPLDLDVHVIPALGDEPQHLHYDIRFLFIAGAGETPRASEESHDVRWFSWAELEQATREESVLRMARKAQRWLA